VNSEMTRRRIIAVVAIVWAAGVFLIVLGALFPSIPLLGLLGTIVESFLSLQILILGVIGALLAGAVWQLGSRRSAALAATLAILAMIGALVPLLSLTRAASRYGASISWPDHLTSREIGRLPFCARADDAPWWLSEGRAKHGG